MENIFHPTCCSCNVIVIVLHWEMGSTFSPLESEQVCVYSRNDAMRLPRLSHKSFSTFFNLLPGPRGSLSLELNHHALSTPGSHVKFIHRYSVITSWNPSQHRVPNLWGFKMTPAFNLWDTPADSERRATRHVVYTEYCTNASLWVKYVTMIRISIIQDALYCIQLVP